MTSGLCMAKEGIFNQYIHRHKQQQEQPQKQRRIFTSDIFHDTLSSIDYVVTNCRAAVPWTYRSV